MSPFSNDPVVQEAAEAFDLAQTDQSFPVCFFCSRPVEPAKDYKRVYGWVSGNGRDGFKRDGYGDEYAHKHCIEVNKTVGPDQQGMF